MATYILTMYFQQEDALMFGIDWDGPITTEVGDPDRVALPLAEIPLSDDDYTDLCELVNPLSTSSNHGIDSYMLTFVKTSNNELIAISPH